MNGLAFSFLISSQTMAGIWFGKLNEKWPYLLMAFVYCSAFLLFILRSILLVPFR
jgi:hypothetical protein